MVHPEQCQSADDLAKECANLSWLIYQTEKDAAIDTGYGYFYFKYCYHQNIHAFIKAKILNNLPLFGDDKT